MERIRLILLIIALLTACAPAQPQPPTSPLPQPAQGGEAPARSPLPSPVASQIEAPPRQTPTALLPDDIGPRIFVPPVALQPEATPTRVVVDFSRTSPTGVARTRAQISLFVEPLLGRLQDAASSSQSSLFATTLPSAPPWESASYRLFLPLVFNQPETRIARARRLYDCDQVSTIPNEECEILLLFYLDTNGPRWLEQRNWLTGTNPCVWKDLQCSNGHVKVLQLENNDLTGVLSPEISDLQLTFLLLKGNRLGGSVPGSIGAMAELESIDLSGNQFTGSLPPDIVYLPRLRSLAFDRDKLWFDTDLFTCAFVETIPKDECEALVSIYRTMNGETWNIKASFPRPPSASTKLFAEEWLIGADPCLWKGIICVEKHLDILDLHDSNLSGRVSPDFGKLIRLGQLNLSQNHLYGPIPLEFTNLTNLRFLRLAGNVRPPEVADDPTAHLCIPSAVIQRLEQAVNAEDMPPGGFCPLF